MRERLRLVDGKLSIVSGPMQGTEIHAEIPLSSRYGGRTRNRTCGRRNRVMTRPRVLLADDHRMFADALKKVLEPRCEVVGTVSDGRAS